MDSYYLHSLPGSQASEDACTQASHSMEQHSRLYSLQGATSQHLLFGQQYLLPIHGGHDSFPTHQMPRPNSGPSFSPPAESRSSRATSSISNHGYYHADRASVPHQGWAQQPYPAISAPISASGAVMQWPYDAVIGNCASARRQNPSQSSPAANKFAADLPFDPALHVNVPVSNPNENIPSSAGSFTRRQNPSQSSPAANRFVADPPFALAPALQVNVPVPNTNENIPSSMGSFPIPGQTLPPTTHRRPVSPPFPLIDPQDIEYAQYRYGKKRSFYRCRFDLSGSPCNKWIVGDRTRVLRHLRSHHHLQTGPAAPAVCRWEKCTHSRPMKHENLSRHVVMHLGVKWKCPHCSRLFSRDDAVHRHMERMAPGMEVSEAEVMPGRDARAITDSQFKRARTA